MTVQPHQAAIQQVVLPAFNTTEHQHQVSHYYTVYGLNIALNQALPQLRSVADLNPDVSIDLSRLRIPKQQFVAPQRSRRTSNNREISISYSQDWICVHFPRSPSEILSFYIRKDGSEVISDKPESIPTSDVESFLLGPILGAVLRLRQRMCLHASVIEYQGKAFAMVGNKGAGKSTTAAALLDSGARLISDDIAVFRLDTETTATVYPGYPGIRLMPAALNSFDLNQSNYARVVSTSDKRYVPLNEQGAAHAAKTDWQFHASPCRLHAVYILNSRQPDLYKAQLNTLPQGQALMALAPHAYGRSGKSQGQREEEFEFMAQLSRNIPIKSVDCPNKLELLPNIAEDILADVSNIEQRH